MDKEMGTASGRNTVAEHDDSGRDDLDERARELARRVMSLPPKPRTKQKEQGSPKKVPEGGRSARRPPKRDEPL